jgi:polysaccharide chain length determinant protein (PEP-CTERM system associated)
VPGFTISFTYSEPRTAQLVCNRITSMFIDEDLMRRQGYAQGTVNFIENQLQEAKRKLDEQEGRQAEFKRRNVGQMPGQDDKHLGLLMSANAQLDATTQALNRAQADKTYLESMLQQYLAVSTTAPDGSSPLTLERQLSTLQSELVTLEGRYTPGHPDVVKKKNEIAQMQARVEEQRRIAKAAPEKKEETAAVVIEPPHIQQIRNQVRLLDQTIREKAREQARLQESVRLYQARVQLSPQVEQEYKELTRDYDNARGNYDDLLGKKTAAERSLELMKQQQGEQFRIMDAANLPSSPSEPNRLMFAGGGLGGGAALGLGIVLILEMKDKAIRNELDIEYFLELPALAQVPTVGAEAAPGRTGFRKGKPASVEQAARA